ncbi:calmodulin-binding receptor-like cytoplasmic kinase 2 [Actinidia rufa]|uniref:non-specific serine/threonine protein kinase n=1 Tax=Actinidia rufa TaxID=165716 RepID=A0A7J0EV48_9ERIC|nr:calmodulin-binding receptor-like cytoplasmic kinase 2 [Actinidia rufa]
MRNRESPNDGRISGSGNHRTPERYAPSPGSGYWSSSSSQMSTSSRNPVRIAARSISGAFVACFTPPEVKKIGESEEFNAPSVASDASVETKRRSSRGIYAASNDSTRTREPGSVKFTMTEIFKATRNFSPTFKIGQVVLGQSTRDDLKMEHLLRLNVYEDERIVVVEYVPNGTLREHLDYMHGNVLDFAARLDISIDVAHAVTYLHMYTDHPIIHRDIKSSNILLTENLRAKVADFGFARFAADTASGATHVSTQVKGTAGYLDPEYIRTNQLTEKSDVYSFGVLLVELVTGRRPIERKRELQERLTPIWAIKKFIDGEAIMILDPRLDRSAANNVALEKILELALKCLANQRQNRPTMKRCAEILWSIRKDYRELSGFGYPLSLLPFEEWFSQRTITKCMAELLFLRAEGFLCEKDMELVNLYERIAIDRAEWQKRIHATDHNCSEHKA